MNKWVLLLGCLIAATTVAQTQREIWMWTDSNGVTHYTDRPVPGAKKLSFSVSEPEAPPPPAPGTTSEVPAEPAAPEAVKYRSLEIWQPENGESFFEADTVVNVRIRVEPDLAEGDRLLLYLDGKLVEGPEGSLEYALEGIDRGAHSLTAVILDPRGNEKIRSEPRVFHRKQPTIISPRAVGPNVRPPQGPRPR